MGNNISRHFRCAHKRQLQVVSSCSRCRHISPPHCISANSCDRPGRHLSIATIRVNPCDSWAIIHSLLIAPAKDYFKLSKLFPLSSYIPPIALVTIRATDPVAIYPLQLFVSIREIRGQYKFVGIIPPLIIKYSLSQPITHILSICEISKT